MRQIGAAQTNLWTLKMFTLDVLHAELVQIPVKSDKRLRTRTQVAVGPCGQSQAVVMVGAKASQSGSSYLNDGKRCRHRLRRRRTPTSMHIIYPFLGTEILGNLFR